MQRQEYREFLGRVQPIAVGLISNTTRLDRDAFWKALESADPHFTHLIDAKFDLARVDPDSFNVRVNIEIGSRSGRSEQGAQIEVFALNCTYEGHFHCEGAQTHRMFAKRFAETEARLVLWPFVREFVADVTSRMAIPPLMLPLTVRPAQSQTAAASPATDQPSSTVVAKKTDGDRRAKVRSGKRTKK